MTEENVLIECPCCGYFCLTSGMWSEICTICYWEYDEDVGYRGSVPSVVNRGLTLIEARNNFDTYGACEESLVQYVLPFEAREEYRHVSQT